MTVANSEQRARISENLRKLPDWRLSADVWQEIREHLEVLVAALDAGDAAVASQRTNAVLRLGGERAGRATTNRADDQVREPPDEVGRLMNRIPQGAEEADPPEASGHKS